MRFKLLEGRQVELVHFELIPDRTVTNKKVHDMLRVIASFYASPYEVLTGQKAAGAFWWDIMIQQSEIRFICTVPAEWKREIRMHLENTWPLCAIAEVPPVIMPITSDVCEMKYRRNNIFALQTDRRLELEPLNSILSITSDMDTADLARLSVCAEPIGRIDWQEWAERTHREFRNGRTPRRSRLTKRDILVSAGELITGILQSVFDTLSIALGSDESKKEKTDDHERQLLLIDGKLSPGTINKMKTPTFNTYIRIAAHAVDFNRQQIILRTLSNSFTDLTADNELERCDIHPKLKPAVNRELNTHTLSYLTRLDWDKNKMSNEELSRLVELPTASLQDLYSDKLQLLENRQMKVPAALSKGGLYLGDVSYKNADVPVYMPVTNHDDLCYSSIVIAKKGQGKTKGYTCNRAVEFVKQGYSSIIFDVADSEAWEVIEKALPAEKRCRIQLGEVPISLDFSEIRHSPDGRGRLADVIFSFFEDNTDTAGAQTQRFLRAAVMAMQTGKLTEIVRIFRDKEYRDKTVKSMPDTVGDLENFHKQTLIEFGGYEAPRQRQILAPILNRLDVILGDPYLTRCMSCENGVDMLEVIRKPGCCTVIDIPDELNSRTAKDVLVNLLSLKLDIATPFRKKSERFPVAVFYDEPHQYLRSAKLWKNFVAEARKYRLAYHFLFHSWRQIPDDLAHIIKDAGAHYFIFPSGEDTFKGLQRIIAPYTIDEGLGMRKYHAICALNIGDGRLTPFMARMAPPPVS